MSPVVQRFLRIMGLTFILLLTVQALSSKIWLFVDDPITLGRELSGPRYFLVPVISFLPPSALFAQVMYALYGSFFLGVWLWRERRLSQSYYLAYGALLLGLSTVGATLGFLFGNEWLATWHMIPFLVVTRLWMGVLLCGSSMVLVGLLDHWQLVRALRRTVVSKEVER